MRASLLVALAILASGCTLALPRDRHERAPPDPDEGRCGVEGCRETSVCEVATDRCRDCWGPAGMVRFEVAAGQVARDLSLAIRDSAEGPELYAAWLEGPAGGPLAPQLQRVLLSYDEVAATFEVVDRGGGAIPERVVIAGDLGTATDPVAIRVALDARGRVAVLLATADQLVVGVVRHETSGEAWASRTLLFPGLRVEGSIAAWPAAGPALPDVPEVWAGMIARTSDGALEVVGVPPTSDGAWTHRRLPGSADFVTMLGPRAIVGAREGDEVFALDLEAETDPVSRPTPGRTGRVSAADVDGSCALLAWPRGPVIDVSLSDGPAGICGASGGSTFWPGEDASEEAVDLALVPSRAGAVALVATGPDVATRARVFALRADGTLASLAGHGTHGIALDVPAAIGAAGAQPVSVASGPAPWPVAAGAIDAGVVVALGRACDQGVE